MDNNWLEETLAANRLQMASLPEKVRRAIRVHPNTDCVYSQKDKRRKWKMKNEGPNSYRKSREFLSLDEAFKLIHKLTQKKENNMKKEFELKLKLPMLIEDLGQSLSLSNEQLEKMKLEGLISVKTFVTKIDPTVEQFIRLTKGINTTSLELGPLPIKTPKKETVTPRTKLGNNPLAADPFEGALSKGSITKKYKLTQVEFTHLRCRNIIASIIENDLSEDKVRVRSNRFSYNSNPEKVIDLNCWYDASFVAFIYGRHSDSCASKFCASGVVNCRSEGCRTYYKFKEGKLPSNVKFKNGGSTLLKNLF